VNTIQKTILDWLKVRLEPSAFDKLETTCHSFSEGAEDWEVFSSFSTVPRYTGRKPLDLNSEELESAEQLRKGWKPGCWTTDQLGRTLLVLALADRGREEFLDKLEKLHTSADMGEAEALYLGLSIFPWPEDLTDRAAEGIRSNMTSVFEAVALDNPYPADHLDDEAWNQMVLKALFVGSPLYRIQGLEQRANAELARMLTQYAHERWSAGRVVSPELWRPTGPFLGPDYLEEIERVLTDDDDLQKRAAVLALSSSDSEEAASLLKKHRDALSDLEYHSYTWDDIGQTYHESSSS